MEFEVIIIGASQAGLAMGYFLKQKGISFTILGKESRLGDSWRSRYDSLVLFTPRWLSALPEMALPGDQNGYAGKDEIADYLEAYAKRFDLPVQLNAMVEGLEKMDDLFSVSTNRGDFRARQVVVATGPFQKPFVPAFARELPASIYQVHTSAYKNPAQLQNGAVLVVGAGNSGAQIAVELSASREVFLSAGHPLKFFPLQILGKSIFYWFKKMGIYSLSAESALGKKIMAQGDPIMGSELKRALKKGAIKQKPRATKVAAEAVCFEDGSQAAVRNVIWATGFVPDFSWIRIPHALHEKGTPIHKRGISPVDGLFFLGLPWQHSRGSALIGGVGADADFLAGQLQQKQGLQSKFPLKRESTAGQEAPSN